MRTTPMDTGNKLETRASELLDAIFTRRVNLAEATKLIEGIAIPPALAIPWYSALGAAASSRHPELGNWALQKAFDLGCRDAELMIRLQASHLELGNFEAADAADAPLCRALWEAGRVEDMIDPLRRLSGSASTGSGLHRFPIDGAIVAAVLDCARCNSRSDDYRAIRRHLRLILSSLLQSKPSPEDYNLMVLDLDPDPTSGRTPERRLEMFTELLSLPLLSQPEAFLDTSTLKILFRISGVVILVEGGQVSRPQIAPEPFALAMAAAQFVHAPHDERPRAAAGRENGDEGDPFESTGVTRRELASREGHALANLPSIIPIMSEVFGIHGFAHPEVRKSVEEIHAGAAKFFRTGVNSEPGYGRLVSLYCMTNGLSNDFLSFLIRLYNPPYKLDRCEGILGRLESADCAEIASVLHRDGIYRFPKPIPEDLLADLIRYAETSPCYPHPESGALKDPCIYPAGNPQAVLYDYIERDLVRTQPVQRIMADPTLLGVSQAYFGAKPILDALAMWWSTTFSRTASSEAAQLYHFDMERIRWLKWFIYLTDVDALRGPHCFVRGSHRMGRKPTPLIQRGYQRILDSDMASHFPAEDLLEITGPKGSIFVEDTSGFHKGKHPVAGPRLVLEIEYANSLYGSPLTREMGLGERAHQPLVELAERFPQVFCKYAIRP